MITATPTVDTTHSKTVVPQIDITDNDNTTAPSNEQVEEVINDTEAEQQAADVSTVD